MGVARTLGSTGIFERIAAGICAREGRPITFVGWWRYGLPVTACQLAAGALYLLLLFQLLG